MRSSICACCGSPVRRYCSVSLTRRRELIGGNSMAAHAKRRTTLGDFTADRRLLLISLMAVPIGLLCAVVALLLIRMISLFTSIFYYGRFEIPDHLITPAGSSLGWLAIFVPVIGGLIIGLMARYGSDRIRGH